MAGSKRSHATDLPERSADAPGRAAAECLVALAKLKLGRPFRDDGVSEAFVLQLMAAPDRWAPIVIRGDGTVVDGRHRVIAAQRLGLSQIVAVLFDGNDKDAFAEFVRLNTKTGEGLSQRERHRAVRRILSSHPEWADRRIGELCGISPKTVARIRERLRDTFGPGEISWLDVRVGRDGRVRPIDAAAQRERIAQTLVEHPDASLREVARLVGVSPETVRTVRARLAEPVVPLAAAMPSGAVETQCASIGRAQWEHDRAFASREDSSATAEFFDRTDVQESELAFHTASVPLSRVYEVADDARRRAAFWSRLADRVESRAKGRRC